MHPVGNQLPAGAPIRRPIEDAEVLSIELLGEETKAAPKDDPQPGVALEVEVVDNPKTERPTQELPPLSELGPSRSSERQPPLALPSIPEEVLIPVLPAPEEQAAMPAEDVKKSNRRIFFLVAAIILAIPLLIIAVIQPWHTAGKSNDKIAVADSDTSDVKANDALSEQALPKGEISAQLSGSGQPQVSGTEREKPQGTHAVPGRNTPGEPSRAVEQTTQPPRHNDPLEVSFRASRTKIQAGQQLRFTVSWSDGAGHYAGMKIRWNDGTPETGSIKSEPCQGDAPEQADSNQVSHVFEKAGTYNPEVFVTTYTCDGRSETQSASVQITVTPEPSPSATQPSGSPSSPPSSGSPRTEGSSRG